MISSVMEGVILKGCRCMVQNISILPQRKETDPQRFEIGTLAVYPDGLVRGGSQLVAHGRGRRGLSRARARFRSGACARVEGVAKHPLDEGGVGRHSESDM